MGAARVSAVVADPVGAGVSRPLLVTLAVLAAVTVAVVVLTTPWRVLPAPDGGAAAVDAARDFSPAERAVVAAFQSQVAPPILLGLLVGLAVSLLLGLTPLGARLVEGAGAVAGGGWVARSLLGTAALVVVGRSVVLPADVWAASVRREAGLLTQPWGSWAADQAKGLALTVLLAALAMTGLVALARRWPTTWWVPAAGAAAAAVVALSFLYPVVVEPMFARFTSMPPGSQRDRLLSLAERDGVPVSDVLVVDASARGTALNAYVSGFGSTRRLVVYDTLLQRSSPQRVEAVVAHEVGHAARGDVLAGTLVGALAAALGVLVIGVAVSWPPLLARAGAEGAGDPRVAALVLAVVAVLGVVVAPVQMLVSRQIEARADVHALDLTGDPVTYALLHKELAMANRSSVEPPLWRYLWFATHPTAPQRIAATRDWAQVRRVPGPPDLAGVAVSGSP